MAPFLIAIDGPGASGKSTLAAALSRKLHDCPVVPMDEFCYPPSGRGGEWWGESVRDYGVDFQRCLEQVLTPASRGESIQYQRLDWDDFSLKWTKPIAAETRFLILEGANSLRRELRGYFHLKIWLNAPSETQLDRVAMRDGEHMLQHWTKEFLPAASAYQRDHEPRSSADLVLRLGDNPDEAVCRALRSIHVTG